MAPTVKARLAFTIMPKGSALLSKQAVVVSPLWHLLVMLQSYLLQQNGCKAIVQRRWHGDS
jgi:hypothetical protein